MKILNGQELADFIKERHAHQVKALKSRKIHPKLAIIRTNSDRAVDIYMRLKTAYGEDIGVAVDVHDVDQSDCRAEIKKLNQDPGVHGIIVQLPIPDPSQTDEILNTVDPTKDVDGLVSDPVFDAATPTAIIWLLNGYNIDLTGKNIVIVGQGRLVGKPLAKLLSQSGIIAKTADKDTENLAEIVSQADVVITATGKAGLINSAMLKPDMVIIDAGTSTDSDGSFGDLAADVRQRQDLTITPEIGGVGPLTVCALFENVIRAAQNNPNF